MDTTLQRSLISALCEAVISHTDELTALDQAIGDGDHGINMKRGFTAVQSQLEALAAKPLPDALKALGTTLVMSVGGASGPLYGTLFMTLGKNIPAQPGVEDLANALAASLEAVKKLGKSEAGQKTMLDVLVPALEVLRGNGAGLSVRMKARAAAAAEATIPMKAIKGRASFLGERSIGSMDPGARSASLMITVVCETLERAHG
jgi:dihydroxyacetone kinase-like protein